MPDEDKSFGGSLVLNFGKWWRHMQAKNTQQQKLKRKQTVTQFGSDQC